MTTEPQCLYHSPALSEYWFPDTVFAHLTDAALEREYRGAAIISTEVITCRLSDNSARGRIVKVWHY